MCWFVFIIYITIINNKLRKIKSAKLSHRISWRFFIIGILLKQEPKKYVTENEEGRSHKENQNTGGTLIPYFLPFYVLGLFLKPGNKLFPRALYPSKSCRTFIFNSCNKLCHFTYRTFQGICNILKLQTFTYNIVP